MDKRAHWEAVYTTKAADQVSWFRRSAEFSMRMIRASGIAKHDGIIDIGGGASVLADELLDAGFCDVSVLDIAEPALAASKARLGPRASEVHCGSSPTSCHGRRGAASPSGMTGPSSIF
jgi:hypothetical protein